MLNKWKTTDKQQQCAPNFIYGQQKTLDLYFLNMLENIVYFPVLINSLLMLFKKKRKNKYIFAICTDYD